MPACTRCVYLSTIQACHHPSLRTAPCMKDTDTNTSGTEAGLGSLGGPGLRTATRASNSAICSRRYRFSPSRPLHLADAWGFESQAWATLQVSGNFMYVLTLVVLDLQHTILCRAIHALMCLLFYTPLCFTVPPLLRYFTIPHGVLKQDRI